MSNMWKDKNLCKAHFSKIIESGGLLGNMIGKFGKEAMKNLDVSSAKDVLPKLATKANFVYIR